MEGANPYDASPDRGVPPVTIGVVCSGPQCGEKLHAVRECVGKHAKRFAWDCRGPITENRQELKNLCEGEIRGCAMCGHMARMHGRRRGFIHWRA